MPNPYIFAADFVKEYSDDDKKGLDSVNQYVEKIEQMLNYDANNKFIDDFKQFKKHFTTLTDPSLYIGNDENNKKKYVQSAVWLENFMKNPVKAAALANCFEDYQNANPDEKKEGLSPSVSLEWALFALSGSLDLSYNEQAIKDKRKELRADPTLIEKEAPIPEQEFTGNETFGYDKRIKEREEKKAKIPNPQERPSRYKYILYEYPRGTLLLYLSFFIAPFPIIIVFLPFSDPLFRSIVVFIRATMTQRQALKMTKNFSEVR